MLMSRSAPQPAMRKTPMGGTVGRDGGLVRVVFSGSGGEECVLKIVMMTTTMAARTMLLVLYGYDVLTR